MALVSRDLYPQFLVYAYLLDDTKDNGADCVLLDAFHTEEEALQLYNSTKIGPTVLEVDLERDDGHGMDTLRQKDELNEWIY